MMKGDKRLSCVKRGLAACAILMAASVATAAEETARGAWDSTNPNAESVGLTPVMVSLFSPVEIPWWRDTWDVSGFRLSLLYGRCRDFTGLDLGLVTHTDTAHGLQFGAVNIVESDVRMTLTVGLFANVVGGSYTGFEFGGVNVVSSDTHALQVGLVNVVGGTFTGLQVGLVNVVPEQMRGAWQVGFWNHGGDLERCGQIGIFNYARDMSAGVQFGLVNIIEHNEYPCIPFLNWHF